MKNFLTVLCLAITILFGQSAYAEEKVCGYATVDWIMVFESDCNTDVPVHPCLAEITIITDAGQLYVIPVKACGTLLNHALLKAHNELELISMCLWVNLYPFEAWVSKVDFGEKTLAKDHYRKHCGKDICHDGHDGWSTCQTSEP